MHIQPLLPYILMHMAYNCVAYTSGSANEVCCKHMSVRVCVCELQFTDPKLGSDLKFEVMDFKGPTREQEDNVSSSMLDSAKIFSEIWETGVQTCWCTLPRMGYLLCL